MKMALIYSSELPDAPFMRKLEEIARSLDIGFEVPKPELSYKVCIQRGDLPGALLAIEQVLRQDYKQLSMEEDEPYRFEYVLSVDGFGRSAVAFLTRLYSPTSTMGSIFYGGLLVREAENMFAVWVDPE
jgi:hypothetical protein